MVSLWLNLAEAENQHSLILQHIRMLREVPGCESAWIVLAPESNLGFEAQHYVATIQKAAVKDWVVITESGEGGIGFRTTAETKEGGCTAVAELLAASGIFVAEHFVCASMAPGEAVKMLVDQLDGYQVIVEAPKSAFGKTKRTYSGKVGGRQDDLAIALQLGVLSARLFLRKDKYSKFRD